MDEALSKRLTEAADVVKRRAAEFAAWSIRIPRSLEMKKGENYITIRANPAIAPQARAFELGLRHPLNWPHQQAWGNTPHRPFLEKAVDESQDVIAEKVGMVVEDWSRDLGFKVT